MCMTGAIKYDDARFIGRLLSDGQSIAQVAQETGKSRYVVGLIAESAQQAWHSRPRAEGKKFEKSSDENLDGGDCRRILRMAAVNPYIDQIARACKCSQQTVHRVLAGQGLLRPTVRKEFLGEGEISLRESEKCPTCRKLINVSPCRVCAIRKALQRTES